MVIIYHLSSIVMQDGDRGSSSAGGGNMPQETWARGPPESRDRDRDGGFRGGNGGFRPPPGRWAERRAAAEEGGGGAGERGDGGGKGFAARGGDRGEREKDLQKWGKVRACFWPVRLRRWCEVKGKHGQDFRAT